MRTRLAADFSKPARQTLHLTVLFLLLTVLVLQLVHVARLYSANWDEAHHLYDGYLVLTRHDYRANAEVPPLLKITAALPLLPLHPTLPPVLSDSQTENAFLAGRAFVFGNGGDRLLFPARMACLLFSLLTALLVYLAGRSLFGVLAGLCALALFVFDPLVLANGALVCTDVASACFLLASVYAFYRYTLRPNWARLLLVGLLAGLAMVAKFTGVLVAPTLLVIALAEALRRRSPALLRRLLAAWALTMATAWFIIWLFYGFRYAPAPAGLQLSPALAPYLASLPHHGDAAVLALAARVHLLPEAYLWGLANTRHMEWDYTSYFLGHVYRHGPWQYFPLAFLLKSTLPLLLLLLLTPLAWRGSSLRYGRELIFLLVPVAVYFAVVTRSHFDIGARHLLPVYPFLYVLAGAAAAMLLRRGSGWATIAVILLTWQLVTSLRVAPDYMAYGNEAFGGPLQVRRYLSDANVDWGQQLKAAKRYLDANHIQNCWFGYFPDGAVQPEDYGIHCHRLPTPSGLWWFNLPMSVPPRIDGTVLLSESVLDGVESGDGPLNPYDAFRRLQPVAILQDGLYIYRGTFPVPLASAWVDIRDAGKLAHAGQIGPALHLAQQAATLAPEAPRAQLQLAGALADAHQWPAAVAHYRLAEQALAHQRPDLQADELEPAIQSGLAAALAHP